MATGGGGWHDAIGALSAPPVGGAAAVPDARRRLARAGLVAALWALTGGSAIFGVFGGQRCTIARVFHRPCPGCGMTRAALLLLHGDWRASLHMHPLTVPLIAAFGVFAASTVWTTATYGYPLVHKSAVGRGSIAALVVVYVASIVLWGLRWFGFFGGPVPV